MQNPELIFLYNVFLNYWEICINHSKIMSWLIFQEAAWFKSIAHLMVIKESQFFLHNFETFGHV